MLAARFRALLPAMTTSEALETAALASLTGRFAVDMLSRAQVRLADLEARVASLEVERAPVTLQDSPIG